ncbi:MAG TPA: alpha-glucan family phosphorylase [Fimbriimonas sp.]|nr:alpha-glucan family phosphorylase [Fimbriimonas sp.]
MKHPKFSHAYEVTCQLPEALEPLKKLASNYRWTWDHNARDLFREMDGDLWERSSHNPVLFLNSMSDERLSRLQKDDGFLARMNRAVSQLEQYLTEGAWFSSKYPDAPKDLTIAYFCFEFGISEGLPIYSGGLGILAGDHLKAASDLGIPLVAVGLLYSRGYFRQKLSHDGWQQEIYPQYDFYQMPLTLMRGQDEKPIRIEVEFPDRVVTCQVWRAEVGRIGLYLLDSNLLENQPLDQVLTDSLYGGDEDMRIRQEMILGIGGFKALRAVGINPTVCHMNEGHAAFLSVERITEFMRDHNCDFRLARQVIVPGNVFTTHTPVPAGFDLFNPGILERYMGKTVAATKQSFSEFLKLGRVDTSNEGEAFNMAVLAMSTANQVNGVSELHAAVTREMFSSRWAGYPEDEVPVEPITNGIHTQTWISHRMARLFDRYLRTDWRRYPDQEEAWAGVESIPDEELWQALEDQRGTLVRFVRRRISVDSTNQGGSHPEFGIAGNVLDPRVLTVGFARRFATYKRGSLMLTDRERLKKILFHPERPVQIMIAGKAHPRDDAGKKVIQDLVNFINHDSVKSRMVFLEDYDMQVARALVQGVDLWLNNPRRPHEASGTSGMKVIPNGGLNCSILDGWWDEGYEPGVGWAIGDRNEYGDQGHQDWLDSRAFYQLLENDITTTFYHRVENGVPRDWIRMVKRSIMTLAPRFSTSRMVRDYTEKFYMPAAERHLRLKADNMARARTVLEWRDRVKGNWEKVRVTSVTDSASTSNLLGQGFNLRALVDLGALNPDDVHVQAVVGKVGPGREILNGKIENLKATGKEGDLHVFEGGVTCDAPGYMGYTVRIVPSHSDVSVPSELELVAWE